MADVENTSFTNAPRILLKIYECYLYTENNRCGVISTSLVEISFGNDYIHIVQYLLKRYMSSYLVSQLIIWKVETRIITWQTICLLLILGTGGKIDRISTMNNYFSDLHKTINRWSDISVMGIMKKKCTICVVVIYFSTTYQLLVYYITYQNLGITHTWIVFTW